MSCRRREAAKDPYPLTQTKTETPWCREWSLEMKEFDDCMVSPSCTQAPTGHKTAAWLNEEWIAVGKIPMHPRHVHAAAITKAQRPPPVRVVPKRQQHYHINKKQIFWFSRIIKLLALSEQKNDHKWRLKLRMYYMMGIERWGRCVCVFCSIQQRTTHGTLKRGVFLAERVTNSKRRFGAIGACKHFGFNVANLSHQITLAVVVECNKQHKQSKWKGQTRKNGRS